MASAAGVTSATVLRRRTLRRERQQDGAKAGKQSF
jgi:hypothetical protein